MCLDKITEPRINARDPAPPGRHSDLGFASGVFMCSPRRSPLLANAKGIPQRSRSSQLLWSELAATERRKAFSFLAMWWAWRLYWGEVVQW